MRGKGGEQQDDAAIAALAGGQNEVVSTAQLAALGVTEDGIRWRVRRGRLHPRHRGVFAWARPALTIHGIWMAAILAVGEGAVLSHRSAGALHGLLRRDGREVEVTVLGGHRRSRAGIRVRRFALQTWEVTTVDGIPVVTPARALLDLSAGAAPKRVADLIDRSERLRVYDDRAVRACLAAHPRHPGAAALSRALEQYSEPPLTDSELERLFLALCERAGVPLPVTQRPHGVRRLDFAWPDRGLLAEVDGWGSHGTRRAFEDDRARDAEHTAQRLRTLRFTYVQVTRHSDWVADILRRTLGAA